MIPKNFLFKNELFDIGPLISLFVIPEFRIFNDILTHCSPDKLLVYARYTRRGGLDINPLRTNYSISNSYENLRLVRQ